MRASVEGTASDALRHVWLAVLAATVPSAFAQQAPTAPDAALPEEIVKYRVEFILFAHTDADVNEERFNTESVGDAALPPVPLAPFGVPAPADFTGSEPPPAETGPSADELKPILPFPDGTEAPVETPFWFRVLRADELGLANTLARLENLRAYRILASGGWVQEGLSESASQPMDLSNLGVVNPLGTLRLHVSRFLHLGVDLEFREQPLATEGVVSLPSTFEDVPTMTKYRMVAQRRARSGELHYIDHPLFGLLFLISPAPEEGELIEDDTGVLAPAI
jgi:hypothetical protein